MPGTIELGPLEVEVLDGILDEAAETAAGDLHATRSTDAQRTTALERLLLISVVKKQVTR